MQTGPAGVRQVVVDSAVVGAVNGGRYVIARRCSVAVIQCIVVVERHPGTKTKTARTSRRLDPAVGNE